MSIRVENVTKIYGSQEALKEVSFEIQPGEVIGFIGPNGAGKSTMMKIICGFLPPSSGIVEVCGYNAASESLKVREKIGYLPENNPLYPDMYIVEYLSYVASIYNLKNSNQKIEDLIDLTGLGRERNKKIGQLSKGYKQRVGIAQALIHDPEVLILDEPTTGLDPNQILEIRELISKQGSNKTVMLSTHLMQEVEAICNRIIIIDQGKIIANDTSNSLKTKDAGEMQFLVVEFEGEPDASELLNIPNIQEVNKLIDGKWLISSSLSHDVRGDIFNFAVSHQLKVLGMQIQQKNLEEIFQKLTKTN